MHKRPTVVWLGGPIADSLKPAAAALGLTVEATDVTSIDPSAEDLLGVLISMDGLHRGKALGRALNLMSQEILEYGVLVGLVSTDRSIAVSTQTLLIDKQKVPADQIRILEPTVEEFSRVLREHEPGLAADRSLDIQVLGEAIGPSRQDEVLLRRAFNGFKKIVLSEQLGGRSAECRVWSVDAYKGSGLDSCEPFIAKAARRADLNLEHANYWDFVDAHIAFPFRAPLVEARRAVGSTRAVLVSMFVGRSQRLDEFLASATNPEIVIESLFTVALSNWRCKNEMLKGSIGKIYVAEQDRGSDDLYPIKPLLPPQESLRRAYFHCRRSGWDAVAPYKIWKKLRCQRPDSHRFCLAHGDLNIGNVFVRWNAVDAILIDFSHAAQKQPMARDLAKLDTSIALKAKDHSGELFSNNLLTDIFQPPLLPPHDLPLMAGDGRMGAIRQIRRHACGEGISGAEYETIAACHLLKFASDPGTTNPDDHTPTMWERRALCYMLGSNLINSGT